MSAENEARVLQVPTNNMVVLYFLAGLATGSAIGLLFAPHAGEETRGQIRDGVRKGADSLRQMSDDLQVKATDAAATAMAAGRGAMEAGHGRLVNEARRVESAFQAGKAAYQRSMEEVPS